MKHTYFRNAVISLLLLVVSGCAAGKQELSVQDVWARPGLAGGTSAVYFVIDNPGEAAEVLKSARSDAAAQVELHKSEMDASGTMTMMPQESVSVPAGGKVEFKAGGYHVMLINLKQALQPGDTFSITLDFEKAGAKSYQVTVKQP